MVITVSTTVVVTVGMTLLVTNRMGTVTWDVNLDIPTHCATDVRKVLIMIFIYMMYSIYFVKKYLNAVDNLKIQLFLHSSFAPINFLWEEFCSMLNESKFL